MPLPCACAFHTMTRREIILQILSEAAGCPLEQAGDLFDSMLAHDMISDRELDQEFPAEEGERLLEDFRRELPGIRRWLAESGLLDPSGHA